MGHRICKPCIKVVSPKASCRTKGSLNMKTSYQIERSRNSSNWSFAEDEINCLVLNKLLKFEFIKR